MGLKSIITDEERNRLFVFKSDQYGIEIVLHARVLCIHEKFKSDQYGIEIWSKWSIFFYSCNVQIRPIWDWEFLFSFPDFSFSVHLLFTTSFWNGS
ncbi:MAG: hypothetical protein AYK18_06100 [Theionarchaea archaeon DG-70]|nr:MAG: hypothetical protein AYK18_06100 [Theionarchaea archaeon DG-70]